MRIIKLIITTLFISLKAHSAQIYSLPDLEILFSQNSYSEYFDHFLDIRPSKRDAKWNTMTLEMANSLIKSHAKKEVISTEVFNKLLKINSQSVLKNDDFFQLQLSKFALLYFKQCSQKQICKKQLQDYWSISTRFEEVDIKLFMVSKLIAPTFSKSILLDIINSKSGNYLCSKDELQKEIIELIIGGENLPKGCIVSIRTELYSQVRSIKSNTSRSIIISALIEANALGDHEKSTSLVLYLLNDPKEGDIFNYAWSELEILSRNYKQRKAVLDTILSKEPYPDFIVKKSDTKKRDVIIGHINKNFPEYFQTYARECVAYYEGSKKYSRGIPALNCDSFFSIAKEKDWISQSLISKYQKAKKI